MDNNQMSEHEKELHHRLLVIGISDGEFLRKFFKRHEVGRSLQNAYNRGPASYEEELEVLVEIAEEDFAAYGLEWPSHVQEGDIPPMETPKKKRRTRKTRDITEPRERQAALGQYLAREVSENERIVNFRKGLLSERVLSQEEALTFLASPLAAAKSLVDFKKPLANPLNQILDTNYRAKEDQDDSGPYRKLVWGSGYSHTIRPLDAVGTKRVYPGDVVAHHDLPSFQLRANRAVILPTPVRRVGLSWPD